MTNRGDKTITMSNPKTSGRTRRGLETRADATAEPRAASGPTSVEMAITSAHVPCDEVGVITNARAARATAA